MQRGLCNWAFAPLQEETERRRQEEQKRRQEKKQKRAQEKEEAAERAQLIKDILYLRAEAAKEARGEAESFIEGFDRSEP